MVITNFSGLTCSTGKGEGELEVRTRKKPLLTTFNHHHFSFLTYLPLILVPHLCMVYTTSKLVCDFPKPRAAICMNQIHKVLNSYWKKQKYDD